jgi:hypothetical protein
MSANLRTTYMRMELANPLVAGASPVGCKYPVTGQPAS